MLVPEGKVSHEGEGRVEIKGSKDKLDGSWLCMTVGIAAGASGFMLGRFSKPHLRAPDFLRLKRL